MRREFTWILAFLSVLILTRLASAAQFATVGDGGAVVFEGPTPESRTLSRLELGDRVSAANVPIQGYFKVRTRSGQIGWISTQSLVFAIPQQEIGKEAVSPPSTVLRAEVSEPAPVARSARFKFFGGGGSAGLTDVDALLGETGLSLTRGVGAEVGYSLSPTVAFVFRAEYQYSQSVVRDEVTLKSYDHAVSSIPMMAGFEFQISRSRNWGWSGALMGGLSPTTRLSTISLGDESPNQTELSGASWAGLLGTQITYSPGGRISYFLESGYLLAFTSQLIPTVEGNGGELYQVDGEYIPIAIDLSGPRLSLGLSVAF